MYIIYSIICLNWTGSDGERSLGVFSDSSAFELCYSTMNFIHDPFFCFVCVEVLRPSQPNGVMSSAVSLPNHTFTGQA